MAYKLKYGKNIFQSYVGQLTSPCYCLHASCELCKTNL